MGSDKKISVLGSTGSIGVQTLDVARESGIQVKALAAYRDVDKIESQIKEFKPELCAMYDKNSAFELSKRIRSAGIKCEILGGESGVFACAEAEGTDTCVAAIVGIAGLKPVVRAIRKKKNIALANKETLVTAGEYVMKLAENEGVNIFPIDSEHSAIFQCICGNRREDIKRILLTASGGPFRGKKKEDLINVKAADALKHPTWSMGAKITVDSATLMNKGLEVIEASWLFGISPEKIVPVVHPQSIIHSMVEFKDGSIMAQMGTPDMRLPISLSLTWPQRTHHSFSVLDLFECGPLTFERPDTETFRCLTLAFEAMKLGGTVPAAMNGANEACVELFLKGKIGFLQIAELIEEAMNVHIMLNKTVYDIDDVDNADMASRRFVYDKVGGI